MIETVSWFNPAVDWSGCKERLLRTGRVQVHDVLRPEIAARLHECLSNEVPWDVAFRDGGKSRTLRADVWRSMPGAQRIALHQRVCTEARQQFQFWYFSYMMVSAYMEQRMPGHFLNSVVEWLNSAEFLTIGRHVSGFDDIRKADGQATLYGPGCFLTNHDDSGVPEGQTRRMAYVLSLTKEWRAEWGGLLHFTSPSGEVMETLMPRYNSLNLFLTPQPHEVSFVAPFASQQRLSITGWLRAD
ncbi:MAG: 2OG-Fe(II) oxygenase [Pseudomonadota bacterium]